LIFYWDYRHFLFPGFPEDGIEGHFFLPEFPEDGIGGRFCLPEFPIDGIEGRFCLPEFPKDGIGGRFCLPGLPEAISAEVVNLYRDTFSYIYLVVACKYMKKSPT
jgi:hypothetical protein